MTWLATLRERFRIRPFWRGYGSVDASVPPVAQQAVPAADEAPDIAAVFDAEDRYTTALKRVIGRGTAVGIMLAALQLIMVVAANSGVGDAGAALEMRMLSSEQGASALLILVPLAIALQVVVRLPRDPEGVDADEAVAHRQFWGNVARISTMAAAFVAASTAIGNFLFSLQLPLIDVVELLGVPAGATIAMVLASDAAAVADQQAERLRLAAHRVAVYRGRLERAMRRLDETAYASDSETSRKSRGRRAARSMLARAALGITTSVGVGAWVTAVHFGHTGLTLAYVLVATILVVFVTWGAIDVAVYAAMDQLLDAVMTVSLAAMIVVVFSLTGATSAMTIGGGDDYTRYLAGLAFGFLLGFPSLWVIGLLLVRVGPGRRKPPLRAVAWARLDTRLARTRMKSGPEREPWRSFAVAAILLSPIPPAGWAFIMMALWRRGPSQNGKRLLFWSWAVTVSLAGVEIAALISLPLWL